MNRVAAHYIYVRGVYRQLNLLAEVEPNGLERLKFTLRVRVNVLELIGRHSWQVPPPYSHKHSSVTS